MRSQGKRFRISGINIQRWNWISIAWSITGWIGVWTRGWMHLRGIVHWACWLWNLHKLGGRSFDKLMIASEEGAKEAREAAKGGLKNWKNSTTERQYTHRGKKDRKNEKNGEKNRTFAKSLAANFKKRF